MIIHSANLPVDVKVDDRCVREVPLPFLSFLFSFHVSLPGFRGRLLKLLRMV